MLDDLGTDLESFLDVHRQVQRGVLPVAQLDDAGNADKVHPAAEIEAADDRRYGENQDRQVLVAFHHGMGDRAAAAQMAEAESVAAGNKDTGDVAPRNSAGTPHGNDSARNMQRAPLLVQNDHATRL